MPEDYACKQTGIDAGQLEMYELLVFDDCAGTKKEKQERMQERTKELGQFGKTRKEIINYFNAHLNECKICRDEHHDIRMCIRH